VVGNETNLVITLRCRSAGRLRVYTRAGCLLLAVFAAAGMSVAQRADAGTKQGWRLVWSDEFNGRNGSGIDPSKWTAQTGSEGLGNRELEIYTARRANLRVENGDLVIEARREALSDKDGVKPGYTSARLQTLGHFSQRYGRFEARMRLPLGKGLWPAFWMLGADTQTNPWPACGEIDVMENIGEPQRVYGTIHGPGYSGAHGIQGHDDLPPGAAVNTGFHTYAVEWAPKVMRFSVDGHVYATRTPKDLPPGTRWVYDRPFFMLLNLAVGGSWPGNPDATTQLPQKLLVDWVRVYAR
jgi:beta-glucanase (GH16 family)